VRHVVFVAPYPLQTTLRFSAAIASLDRVKLTGVFQQKPQGEVAALFANVALVDNVFDPAQVVDGVRSLEALHGPAHRVLGILEELQGALAQARQVLGLPGIDPATSHRFRDKGVMKRALEAASVPCARHARLRSARDAWDFIDEVGFPVVLKPPAGAGCRATWRVSSPQELAEALRDTRPSAQREVLAEEFLTGSEYTFETLTLDGRVGFHHIGRYYPAPLEVMEKPWIQWCILCPRDISGPVFDQARGLGQATIAALGLGTSITHMEWFRRPDGRLAVGEIAARPPGAQIVDLMSQVHDRDMHLEWARLMVDHEIRGPYQRKFAAGVAFLRGLGEGRVAKVEGLDEAQRKLGHLVVRAQLPQVGAPRRPGYEGEGYAMVRHPDTNVVKEALFELITTVKVHYA